MTGESPPAARFRFRDAAFVLDVAAVVSLGLAAYCLFTSTDGIRVEIAGKRLLSISRFQRPWLVFLGLALTRVVVTVRYAPQEFRARYRTRWGRMKPRLAALGLATALGLTTAEIVCRRAFHPEVPPSKINDLSMRDSLGFYPDRDGTWGGALLVTDRYGFRARPSRPEPSPAARRVLLLGDSYAFGIGLAAEETFACRSEDALARRGVPAHIFNGSVPGTWTAEQHALLVQRGLAVRPDAVVLTWCFNDALPDPEGWSPLVMRVSGRLKMFGIFYERVVWEYERRSPWAVNGCYEEDRPRWRECREVLLRIRDLARESGFRFGVLVYPMVDALDPYPLRPAHEALDGFLEREGVEFLDLLPLFEGKDSEPMWVHPEDTHPSAAASRIAGEALAEWLSETLLPD